MPGRVALGTPYKSISDQAASEAWNQTENNDNQIFVNSSIEETLNSLKTSDKESIKLNHAKTLKGTEISKDPEHVIHTTYNQLINISYEDMATFDYVVIDEAHTLSDGLDYRSDVIGDLIHYLVEFVAKNRNSKTKIIFMTGTPNVETHVIQEVMEEFQVKSLFQRIIVNKEYKITPLMHLVHLDTEDAEERQNTIIRQIDTYLKQERKVCYVFNHKAKMDEYIREIQTKLSPDIKVGLFYSGSSGECTKNILAGKFGEYDVVLTTSYFINGININKDGITREDFENGKKSTQKYGVVIDLDGVHTRVNAMDSIQIINRFRNRQCHSSIFLPKIFKPDLKNTSRKFDFGNAGKVVLGINRYNHHLLSNNKNTEANQIEEPEQKEELYLLDQVKKNPLMVSMRDISAASKREENRKSIITKIKTKARLYEDWFYSLEGFYYLAKDAGILPIMKHKYIQEPLKKMTEDQIELENRLIRNFLEDRIALKYLNNQLDSDKRIMIKSSGVITDPKSDQIGNFKVVEHINDKYVVEADFHFSHERAINKLIRYHLSLCYWYGTEKAIELLQIIINPKANAIPIKESSHFKNINNYLNCCYAYRNPKLIEGVNYVSAIDTLSQKKLGIKKVIAPTYISYTVTNNELVQVIKDKWAQQQFEMLKYKIRTSNSQDKKGLQDYYSDPGKIRNQNLESLEEQLNKLATYKPLKYNKKGNLITHETIIIPRIMSSDALLSPLDIDIDDIGEPEVVSSQENLNELQKFFDRAYRNLDIHIPQKMRDSNQFLLKVYNTLKDKLASYEIQTTQEYVDVLINDSDTANHEGAVYALSKIKTDLSNLESYILSVFKGIEYSTHRGLKIQKVIPFVQKSFFCDKGFKLENLVKDFNSNLNSKSLDEIYDSLFECSASYTNTKRIRTKSGKKSLKKLNRADTIVTKPAYLVFDKKGEILFSEFSIIKTCKFLCKYAYNNERFIMKDGSIPVKEYNRSVYNPSTFKRDYYANDSKSKTPANYSIKVYDINILEYKDYISSL